MAIGWRLTAVIGVQRCCFVNPGTAQHVGVRQATQRFYCLFQCGSSIPEVGAQTNVDSHWIRT